MQYTDSQLYVACHSSFIIIFIYSKFFLVLDKNNKANIDKVRNNGMAGGKQSRILTEAL